MRVSFVLPSFNSATWLAQAVQSCLEQTHKDIEVVVVDDGSTDSTKDYLAWQKNADTRVFVLTNKGNRGRSYSRNLGNEAATGGAICVLDADDLALQNRAKIVSEKFEKGAQFLYGSAVQIDPCGRTAGEIRADVFNKDKAMESGVNRIVHSTVAYTPEFAKRFPYRDGEAAKLGLDDWAQQIEAACAGVKLDFVPNILSAYRILSGSVSHTRKDDEVKAFKVAFLEAMKQAA